MESAVMKQLCLVAIVQWLSVSAAVGTQHSLLTPHTQGNKAGSISNMGCPNNTTVCQDGFEQLGWQKCYLFSCYNDTWDGALAACQSMGATLAYPLNAAEDTALSNYIRLRFPIRSDWWIGGTNAAIEGQWIWAHDNSPIVYTNWAPGQPDNYNGDEYYLSYSQLDDFKWNDLPRTYLNPFICQQL